MTRRPPRSLASLPIARSYAREDAEGNLLRVVVYRDPVTGGCVQVTSRVGPGTAAQAKRQP